MYVAPGHDIRASLLNLQFWTSPVPLQSVIDLAVLSTKAPRSRLKLRKDQKKKSSKSTGASSVCPVDSTDAPYATVLGRMLGLSIGSLVALRDLFVRMISPDNSDGNKTKEDLVNNREQLDMVRDYVLPCIFQSFNLKLFLLCCVIVGDVFLYTFM